MIARGTTSIIKKDTAQRKDKEEDDKQTKIKLVG